MLDAATLDRLLDAPREEAIAVGVSVAGDQAAATAALDDWFKTQVDDRAWDTMFAVLLGIKRTTPLAWNHGFYWSLCTGGDRGDVSTVIEVLGDVLSRADASEYAARHARRWFRAVYERGAPLTPEAQAVLSSLGVSWELSALQSLAEVWDVLIAMTCTDEVRPTRVGKCRNVWELIDGSALAGDVLIADYIRANPRTVEVEVLVRIGELAERQGSVGNNALSNLLEGGLDKPGRWTRTWDAWDAELGLQLFETAQRRNLLAPTTQHNSFHVASLWIRRAPARLDGISPEMADVLRNLADKTPLPLILPEDISGMTPAQIEDALATYCGITVEELYRRLQPGVLSATGFIAAGENLGELIAHDATTLRHYGVSRAQLADRLTVILRSGDPDYEVSAQSYMGHQHDPFHTYDVYAMHGHFGATDFSIRRGNLEVHGGDLQIPLIRRVGLFGGPGCYRLDPETLIRLLELA